MRRFLILATALFAALPAAAQQTQPAAAQGGSTYRSAKGGFALDLPAGWVRAPESAVEEVRRAAPASPGLTHEAVFQVSGSRWPAPPFASIARGVTPGGLTPAEFRRRWTADEAQGRLQGDAVRADTLRGVRVGMRVGVPWWDEANRAAWLRADVEATGGFVWTVLTLHPSGGSMVILTYYSAAGADEERVLADLDGVIRSLRPD